MKKTLAVCLTVLIVATALFALSLSGMAADSNASEVKITPTSGTAVTLNVGTPSVTMGDGTVSFDPATGTLTMDGASGIKMISATGNVTVLLKGTNSITSVSNFAMSIAGTTTFTGTGTLNMDGYRGVYSSKGDLIAKDSVKINIDVNDFPYSVRSGSTSDGNMIFEDSAQVYVKVKGLGIYQHTSTNAVGTTIISDSASVTVESTNAVKAAVSLKNGLIINGGSLTVTSTGITAEPTLTCGAFTQNGGTLSVTANTPATVAVNCTAFKQTDGTLSVSAQNTSTDGLVCTGFEKTGGNMTVTVAGNASQYKVQGFKVVGNDSTVVTFGGGNLTVNMSSAMTSATDVHAMYLHHVAAANFSGANVTLNVTTPKAGNYSSAILTGWSKAINITGGKIVANLNDNTTGLICPRFGKDAFALTVSGGTVTGTAPSLLNTSIGGDSGEQVTTSVAVKILDGAKINLSTAGGVFSSAKQYTVDTSASTAAFVSGYGFDSATGLVTSNMESELYNLEVYDADGNQTILNKQNPSMAAGNGTIVYDPAAGTLTMTDATARNVKFTMGDLKIIAKGTNLLKGNMNFLVQITAGDLTFGGDGTLKIETNGMGVYASAGDLIAEDSITLNVSGKSLVYCVKNSNATDGNIIFRDDVKVTINGTGYQAILQNEKSPYNTDQKMLIEDSAAVEVNIPNASSGASGTYTSAIYIRGLKMTGGSLTLNLTGAVDASSRALGIQVQAPNQDGAVELLGGKLTINHVSQKPGESLAYSLYTYGSTGITFGGTEIVMNLTSAKSGDTSGVICPAKTPFVKMTGGSLTVNANDKTMALITPRLEANIGFIFEMTGGTITGKVPSFLNTNLDGAETVYVSIKDGAKINLETENGALSAQKEVTVNTSGTTATFLDGCGVEYGNEYLITSNSFAPGQVLTGVVIKDASGTTTLNYGRRTYLGGVGQILLDPEKKVLTFDGIVGDLSVSVPADVEILVKGRSILTSASGSVLTVDGILTLTGSGTLELNGTKDVLSADSVKIEGATLKLTASQGNLMKAQALNVLGISVLKGLASAGDALNVDSVLVEDSAVMKIYADGGNGISAKTLLVRENASVLTEVTGCGMTLSESADLENSALVRVYAGEKGILVNGAAILAADSGTLTVNSAGTGIVLDGTASVATQQEASVAVDANGVAFLTADTEAKGTVKVTGGSISAFGDLAFDLSKNNITITAPYILAGNTPWNAFRQDTVKGTEFYVQLQAREPSVGYRADYSAVEKAIADANALDGALYKNYDAVTAAVNAVDFGKTNTEQAAVDAMAKAINDALAALEYKDADYTAVNKAVADAKALDKTLYKDFSAVEAAVNAVVTGKKANEQDAVDAMAKAINDAISALERKNPPTSDVALAGFVAATVFAAAAAAFVVMKKRFSNR